MVVERVSMAMYAVNCVAATTGHEIDMYIEKRPTLIMFTKKAVTRR